MKNKKVEELFISNDCVGCNACVEICPERVLTQGHDSEGFSIPLIKDLDKCIDCGLCLKVCQIHNGHNTHLDNDLPLAYIAQGKHHKLVKNSSSGGAFIEIAQFVIRELNGYVAGAAFDESLQVRHIITNDLNDLHRIQGSKYVQSNLSDIFTKIKAKLKAGRFVLFSGTPCQVYGLKLFLDKDYDNLLSIDIICHGVTSPALLKHHIELVEHNCKAKVKNIIFRWKNPYLKSSKSNYMMIMKMKSRPRYVKAAYDDAYMNIYLNGWAFRECCYKCRFANLNRVGDFTIGDCDSHDNYPQFHPKESNSTVIVNTPKARQLWGNTLSEAFDFDNLDLEREAQRNHQLNEPFKKDKSRDGFYSRLFSMSGDDYLRTYDKRQNVLRYMATRTMIIIPHGIVSWTAKLLKRK